MMTMRSVLVVVVSLALLCGGACPAREFGARSGLRAIVTGMEHSGTTILSNLLKCSPAVMGAFECGVLLAPTPRQFEKVSPFYEWMVSEWRLSREERDGLANSSNCHAQFYEGLRRLSPLFTANDTILDKTPAYMSVLDDVMRRAPGVPVLVSYKPKDHQFESWKKRGLVGANADARYEKAQRGYERAKLAFPHRILEVNHSDVANRPDDVLPAVFAFVGLEWRPEYASLEALRDKYRRLGLNTTNIPLLQTSLKPNKTRRRRRRRRSRLRRLLLLR